MGKKYFILNTDKRGKGVAKLLISGGKPLISFDVKNFVPLNKNEVFKGYVLNNNHFSLLGSMEDCKETFQHNIAYADGVIITRKNLDTLEEDVEFWSSSDDDVKIFAENAFTKNKATITIESENKISTIVENELNDEKPKEVICNTEQILFENDSANTNIESDNTTKLQTFVPDDEISSSENNTNSKEVEIIMPDSFTFENFFGGGFEWQRVSGYFSLYHYSIMQHIMSGRNVYEAINRFGYYYSGIKESENIKYIATAIPIDKGYSSPFSGHIDDTYIIKDDIYTYNVICVGIDDKGEFFVEI